MQAAQLILNERILRITVALAEELHFGRAAARLHVSQSALSGALKNLERDLGVRLFTRTSRHVELTEAGRVLAEEARHLIEEGERTVALVRRSSSDVLGPLCLGYPESIDLRWLCSLLNHARTDTRLAVDLECVSTPANALPYELIKRTLHAAILAGHICHPDLQCAALFREPFAVVASPKHAFSQSNFVGFDQLKGEPVVWLGRDSDPLLYDRFMMLCSSHGYRPNVVQEVRTFQECLEFARSGVGITFLPSFMQSNDCDKSAVFVRVRDDVLHAEYQLAYHRNGGLRDVGRFVRFVQDQARKKHSSRGL